MKRTIEVAIVAFVAGFVIALATSVFAEESNQRLAIAPFVIDIGQSVPVTLTMQSPEMGPVIVPAMVDVALTVEIRADGSVSPTVEIGMADAPVVTVAPLEGSSPPLVDIHGLPYEADILAGLTLDQVNSRPVLDRFSIVGLIRNHGEQSFRQFELKISLMTFDAEGRLLDVSPGFLDIAKFDPGEIAPFNVITPVDTPMVARYLVQISD